MYGLGILSGGGREEDGDGRCKMGDGMSSRGLDGRKEELNRWKRLVSQ